MVARVAMPGRRAPAWNQEIERLTSGPALALAVVLVIGAAVRLFGLDSLEPNVMPDEADNLQAVYRILVGRGPGLAGLSWNGEPSLNLHFMALCMHLFGMSIVAMRLGAVIPSLLSVLVLYLLAREHLSVRASLIAAFLFSTSLWCLSFSRNAWTNVYVVLYTLVAAYAISLALRKERWWLCYGLAGLAVALGLHSDFSGRTIIVGLFIYLPVALIVFPEQRRRVLIGWGIVVAASVLLFLPLVPAITKDWDAHNKRIEATYIFAPDRGEALSTADKLLVLADQTQRNLRGFVLMDGSVVKGFRYTPPGQPLLDRLTALLFLAGLALSFRHWRETSLWWCLAFAHVAGTQLLSTNTPDAARALGAVPFYFLFVGLLFDRLFVRRTWYRGLFQLGVLALIPVIALVNVSSYVDWMRDPKTAAVRQPAVENWEFATWQELQLADARAGKWGFTVNQWHQMRQTLNIPRAAAGAQPKPTPLPRVGATINPTQVVTPRPSLIIDGRELVNGQLKEPNDVAVDADGYIYVADTGNHRIQKFDWDGRFVARWGQPPAGLGPGDGPLELAEPLGIVVDPDGNIVVLDSTTCWVKKYSPSGEYLGQWAGPSQGMYHPRGMTIDSQGNIWIADTGRCRVLKYSPKGELLTRIGPAIAGTRDMLEPVGIAFDADGNVYVTDVGNFRLLKLNRDLELVAEWPLTSAIAARGHHLALTRAATLLATDPEWNRLLEFSRDGQVLRGWGGSGSGPGQFKRPVGVEIKGDDVYVADTFNNRVQRLPFE